jgi:hypothetical protein
MITYHKEVGFMSIGIGDNLTGSFGYAKDNLWGKFGNWLILAILTIIPIVNWIAIGTYIKVLRGEEPKLENIGKSFVDGLLALIICIIYMLIPAIIAIILGVGGVFAAGLTGSSAVAGGVGIGIFILCLILFLLFSLLMIPAIVNFARKGFGAAFSLGEIFGMISKAGWLKYILAIIVIWIIFAIISLLGAIPFIGWLIMIILAPFLSIWSFKYFANLFE